MADEGGYDPRADEEAARLAHRRKPAPAAETSHMSRSQLEELRRVQNERVQVAKMKQLGLKASASMGVRMDGTEFDRR